MKINYVQHTKIIDTINRDLNDVRGDLALELFELEAQIEDAFRAHTKQALRLQSELTPLHQRNVSGSATESDVKELMRIEEEVQSLYKKEKKIVCNPFPFGDGSERDLKPYLTLKGIKAMKPLLDIGQPKPKMKTNEISK